MKFSKALLNWFEDHGRKNLPWQQQVTAYRVWVSEIMLQQTQVKTVIPYFTNFIQHYPDIKALANSSVDDVLAQWTGLGYYARARNLHKTAQIVQADYAGIFPSKLEQLDALPGIGLSTAGAILSLAMKKHAAILDGNCKRVYARHFKVKGYTASAKVQQQLWALAQDLTPDKNSANFNQAMMDLGSMVCTRTKPGCKLCPLSNSCQAYQDDDILVYPEKKPAKKHKHKSTVFVIVLSHESKTQIRVFLEKRPPAGIWGGLWCFPEFADEKLSMDWLSENYSNYSFVEKITPPAHIFSHFRLNYSVLVVRANKANIIADTIADNEQGFFSINDSLQLGLATPIKKLLKSLKYTQTTHVNK